MLTGQLNPLLVRLTRQPDILEEIVEFVHAQRLWAVYQCLAGHGMEVDEDHVGPGNDPLRGDVKDIQYAFRRGIPASYGV